MTNAVPFPDIEQPSTHKNNVASALDSSSPNSDQLVVALRPSALSNTIR